MAPSAQDVFSDLPAGLRDRLLMTVSCPDCDDLPKVADAGRCFDSPEGPYQVMHNGVKVRDGCYQGAWMSRLIARLRGHHEPQEEKAFHTILPLIRKGGTMIEMGAFWAYYSLWFNHQVPDARNLVLEPDPNRLEVARGNFALNRRTATILQARAGARSVEAVDHFCDSDRVVRQVPERCIDDLVREEGIEFLDLLHADIQGAEVSLLEGLRAVIRQKRVRFVFLSTHHHRISGDPLSHQKCRRFLAEHGAHVLAEHTVAESFSGDGLIVASFAETDRALPVIPLTYNRPSRSLFGEVEYDLAGAQEQILKARKLVRQIHQALHPRPVGPEAATLEDELRALEQDCRAAARPIRAFAGKVVRRCRSALERLSGRRQEAA